MRCFRRLPKLIAALLVAAAALAAGPAAAQEAGADAPLPDYGSLGGITFGPAPAAPAPAPAAAGEAAAEEEGLPDLAAYGEVAEVYKEMSTIEMTQQRVGVFEQKLRRFIGAIPRYPQEVERALAAQSPTGEASYFLGVLIFMALLLAIGRAGSMLFGIYIALPIMRRIQKPDPVGIVDKLPVLAARVGLQIGGLLVGYAIMVAVGAGFYQEHEPTLRTVIAVFGAYALIQLIDVCWRMVISPFLPNYRIPSFTDAEARRLYRWVAASAALGVTSVTYYAWLEAMGASEEAVGLSIIFLSFVSVVVVMLMIRANGRAISSALLGGETRSAAPWPAAIASLLWRPIALAYLVVSFIEISFRVIMGLALGVPLLGGAFAVLLSVLLVYALTVYVVERVFMRFRKMRALNEAAEAADAAEDHAEADMRAIRDSMEEMGDEEGGGGPVRIRAAPVKRRSGMQTFEDLARRVASLFALGAGVYLMIRIWVGANAFDEGSAFDIAQDLIDIALVGYVVYHAVRIWMDQKIAEETGPETSLEPGDEGGAAGAASRLATLLPLFRSFVLIVIGVTTVLLILMEMGVNVAPLFAGAGVVGLAIGFGAQSLVRDILSGVFFLTDDAFRKGEYIDVGEVKGTVEKISLRSFQLRHHLGALNTIPFGEIKHLTNYSRDWVMMKLPLRLTYDTDVDKVRKLIKNLGKELLSHPTEGHKFVQPLKSQGVYMMEDSAMIIRVKFMTRPGDQWTTRKLVYQEIRSLFEREGIHFAHKEVTVRMPDIENVKPEDLTEQQKRAIGAAARRAVDEMEPAPALADDR